MPASIHGGKARADGALPPGGSRAGRRSRGAPGPCPACCSMDGFVDASPLLRPGPSIGPARAATAPARTHARAANQRPARTHARADLSGSEKKNGVNFYLPCSALAARGTRCRFGWVTVEHARFTVAPFGSPTLPSAHKLKKKSSMHGVLNEVYL